MRERERSLSYWLYNGPISKTPSKTAPVTTQPMIACSVPMLIYTLVLGQATGQEV